MSLSLPVEVFGVGKRFLRGDAQQLERLFMLGGFFLCDDCGDDHFGSYVRREDDRKRVLVKEETF